MGGMFKQRELFESPQQIFAERYQKLSMVLFLTQSTVCSPLYGATAGFFVVGTLSKVLLYFGGSAMYSQGVAIRQDLDKQQEYKC